MLPVGARFARVAARLRRPGTAVRLVLVAVVIVFLVRPLVSRFGRALDQLDDVDPQLVAVGFALQVVSLFCYSLMTRAALVAERSAIGIGRLFRIQLVSRAVSSTVPGGAAAGPTVGYRLMRSAGLTGRATGAALATASVTSAVVLNVLLWGSLVVSVPSYGFKPVYAAAALFGIIAMLLVAAAFVAIVDGSRVVGRSVRFVAARTGADPDSAVRSIERFGDHVESLSRDRPLMARLSLWAVANWLLDAASLWVFLRSFGVTMSPVGLLVAFGVANVLAAIPITPGGLGIVEWAYLPILVTFDAGLAQATIAVASYRVAQFVFPIVLGALAYASLAVESSLDRRRRAPTPGAA